MGIYDILSKFNHMIPVRWNEIGLNILEWPRKHQGSNLADAGASMPLCAVKQVKQ